MLNNAYVQRNISYRDKISKKKLNNDEEKDYIIGLISFVIIFIITIPYILYKCNLFLVLQIYFLNIDLIATILGHVDGPLVKYYKYLYSDSAPLIGFISQTLITLIVLIGIFYIVIEDTKNKPTEFGLSRAIIIVLITFLIPNRFLTKIMHYSFKHLTEDYNFDSNIASYLCLIPGLLLALLFIALEALTITHGGKHLEKILSDFFKNI